MRARAARALVRWVSGWISSAYRMNCHGAKRTERVFGRIGRWVQAVAFPVAQALDREAMVTQMVEECWWG